MSKDGVVDRRVTPLDKVSDLLPLSRSKIYQLIDEGRLQRVKLGNRTFITTSSVEKLLDEAIAAGAQASDDSVDLGKAKALPGVWPASAT